MNEDGLMDFGEAIRFLKEGKKIARLDWIKKGIWICLIEGNPNSNFDQVPDHFKPLAIQSGLKGIVTLPCIAMKTPNNSLLLGWQASCDDILADDWMDLE